MEDNEMIISVFLRHNFTANCNGKAEDRETSQEVITWASDDKGHTQTNGNRIDKERMIVE